MKFKQGSKCVLYLVESSLNTENKETFSSSKLARRVKDLKSKLKMKLFWIMVLCCAVITLVLSKPSEAKTLNRVDSEVHQDILADPRMTFKRIKRQSDDDGGDNENPRLTPGVLKFVGDVLRFVANLLGTL
ncbi:hypothetical protein AVEN_87990-1 [Araneus ventricosus]|uniref:Uncharacterized protein n=1 Tax=Araneus ventricosus TaxID=182803 RepID=A0A4Y2QB71_ARAVE|nr:hypothetical protein AVEN_87990-1 [Araneus ventricosus]